MPMIDHLRPAVETLLATCLAAMPPATRQHRPWAARDSLCRLGRDQLWQRIWQHDTRPITWALTAMDAPTWSQECWQAARPDNTPIYQTERVGHREHRRQAA